MTCEGGRGFWEGGGDPTQCLTAGGPFLSIILFILRRDWEKITATEWSAALIGPQSCVSIRKMVAQSNIQKRARTVTYLEETAEFRGDHNEGKMHLGVGILPPSFMARQS